MTRFTQITLTLCALVFISTGSFLTYGADPISHLIPTHGDGLMMILVGYSLCFLVGLYEYRRVYHEQ